MLRVHCEDPEELTDGMSYGSDVSLTDWARKLAKHEHRSFKMLIAKNDEEGAREHIITLLRDYNDNGMMAEATLLTLVHTVTEEMFQGDPKGKLAYYKSLLSKYRGRGLPLKDGFDLTLVVKQMKKGGDGGSSSAADKAEITNLKTMSGQLKAAINELRSAMSENKSVVKKLEQRLESKKGDDPPHQAVWVVELVGRDKLASAGCRLVLGRLRRRRSGQSTISSRRWPPPGRQGRSGKMRGQRSRATATVQCTVRRAWRRAILRPTTCACSPWPSRPPSASPSSTMRAQSRATWPRRHRRLPCSATSCGAPPPPPRPALEDDPRSAAPTAMRCPGARA